MVVQRECDEARSNLRHKADWKGRSRCARVLKLVDLRSGVRFGLHVVMMIVARASDENAAKVRPKIQ